MLGSCASQFNLLYQVSQVGAWYGFSTCRCPSTPSPMTNRSWDYWSMTNGLLVCNIFQMHRGLGQRVCTHFWKRYLQRILQLVDMEHYRQGLNLITVSLALMVVFLRRWWVTIYSSTARRVSKLL